MSQQESIRHCIGKKVYLENEIPVFQKPIYNEDLLIDPLIRAKRLSTDIMLLKQPVCIDSIRVHSWYHEEVQCLFHVCKVRISIVTDYRVDESYYVNLLSQSLDDTIHLLLDKLAGSLKVSERYFHKDDNPEFDTYDYNDITENGFTLYFDFPGNISGDDFHRAIQVISDYSKGIAFEVHEFFIDADPVVSDEPNNNELPNLPDDLNMLLEDQPSIISTVSNEIKPMIFLCHSSHDKAFIDRLVADLESEGYNYWLDTEQIYVGEDFTEKIARGVDDSEFVVVVLSNNFVMNGPWATEEYRMALSKQVDLGRVVLLPVLLSDCDIPSFLVRRQYADFRSDYENGYGQLKRSLDYHISRL